MSTRGPLEFEDAHPERGSTSAVATQGPEFGLSLGPIPRRPSFVVRSCSRCATTPLSIGSPPRMCHFVRAVAGGLPESVTRSTGDDEGPRSKTTLAGTRRPNGFSARGSSVSVATWRAIPSRRRVMYRPVQPKAPVTMSSGPAAIGGASPEPASAPFLRNVPKRIVLQAAGGSERQYCA